MVWYPHYIQMGRLAAHNFLFYLVGLSCLLSVNNLPNITTLGTFLTPDKVTPSCIVSSLLKRHDNLWRVVFFSYPTINCN